MDEVSGTLTILEFRFSIEVSNMEICVGLVAHDSRFTILDS
jgi:hypothetical protein